MPVGDVILSGVEMAGALADEESADQRDKEHEVAGEGEEHAETIAAEKLTRSAPPGRSIFPIVVASPAAAGRSAVYRRFSTDAGVFPFDVDLMAGEGGGHGGSLSYKDYSRSASVSH
jgi:hypothetical protein